MLILNVEKIRATIDQNIKVFAVFDKNQIKRVQSRDKIVTCRVDAFTSSLHWKPYSGIEAYELKERIRWSSPGCVVLRIPCNVLLAVLCLSFTSL